MPLYVPQAHFTRFIPDADGSKMGGDESTGPPSPASSTHTDSSRNRVRRMRI